MTEACHHSKAVQGRAGPYAVHRVRSRILAFCSIALMFVPACLAQSEEINARATSVNGAVLVSSRNGNAFALTAGFLLSPGDVIDTRGGGTTIVQLSDGSMMTVQAGSVLTFKDFRTASSLRELFEITVGFVRVTIYHFGGRPNPYRMNSPTASIAVRGTQFSIAVGAEGDTQVVVYEGAVEVSSLADPSYKALIEAGRGVLIAPGRAPQLFTPVAGRDMDQRPGSDQDSQHQQPAEQNPASHGPPPPPGDHAQPASGGHSPPDPNAGGHPMTPPNQHPSSGGGHPDVSAPEAHDENSPRATAGAYERYIANLSSIGQLPLLLRFNAFPEAHLDSLENPAWATSFTQAEARVLVLPSVSGVQGLTQTGAVFGAAGALPAEYSISPQISAFAPVPGSRFVVGASFAGSYLGNSTQTGATAASLSAPDQGSGFGLSSTNGSTNAIFLSGSVLAAMRLGAASSAGLEIETLHGSGSALSLINGTQGGHTEVESIGSQSGILQNRITFGLEHDFPGDHKLAVFYRYGFINADERDTSHTLGTVPLGLNSTSTSGHSAEIGLRLRGSLTHRLFYGFTAAWLGLALNDRLTGTASTGANQRDRGQRESAAFGLGYLLGQRTLLSFDTAGGLSTFRAHLDGEEADAALTASTAHSRFISMHWAAQTDFTRHFFALTSFVNVWNSNQVSPALSPAGLGAQSPLSDSFFPVNPAAYLSAHHLSDFGAGWRFSPNLFAQYVYSTEYGFSPASHTLMIRYTFRLHAENGR